MIAKWTMTILAVATAGLFGPAIWRAARAPGVSIDVDFSKKVKTPSMSGLINGFGDNASIADDKILPLRFQHWRGADWHVATASRVNVPIKEIILSSLWGYPSGLRKNRQFMPYNDWPGWEKMCRDTVRAYGTRGTIYDVWNEPDLTKKNTYWDGTEQQFFDTYAHAFRAIRSVAPGAIVGGPSLTSYNRDYIQRFLDSCKAAGVEVNFLSWHELRMENDIPAIKARISQARADWVNNRDYQALKIDKIYINEFLGELTEDRPGDLVGEFRALEDGKADGACKSCWNDYQGNNTCFDNSLTGLLTHDGKHTKASWWTWKYYADGVAGRVASRSNDAWVQSLAGVNPDKTGNVLLAYFGSNVHGPETSVVVHVSGLSKLGISSGSSFQWKASLMNVGHDPVDSAPVLDQGSARSSGDSATIQLTGILYDAAVELTVSPR